VTQWPERLETWTQVSIQQQHHNRPTNEGNGERPRDGHKLCTHQGVSQALHDRGSRGGHSQLGKGFLLNNLLGPTKQRKGQHPDLRKTKRPSNFSPGEGIGLFVLARATISPGSAGYAGLLGAQKTSMSRRLECRKLFLDRTRRGPRMKTHDQPRRCPTPSICVMAKARRPEKAPVRETDDTTRDTLHRMVKPYKQNNWNVPISSYQTLMSSRLALPLHSAR
jgi:hypothetical protein